MDRPVRIIGAPTDYGANRRGVDMGPSAIRYAGIEGTVADLGIDCEDAGDLLAPGTEQLEDGEDLPEGWNARYLRGTEDVCRRLAGEVESAVEEGYLPLVLGGDHSIAMGTLRGGSRTGEIGAVWFDAHADFNTPLTTPSGNVHGMPLAAALGVGAFSDVGWCRAPGLREENVVIVGLRSLDDTEKPHLVESDVTALPMPDIDERGIAEVTREALEVATDGVDRLHVSLDMDWLDPNEAPGVGTPVRGGASYREAHTAMELVAELDDREDVLGSMEIVEVNPILDEHNETAKLATELAASALGRRILP